jgi:hypothetical protein
LLVVLAVAGAGVARADSTVTTSLEIFGYVVPAMAAGLAAGVNGALLAFDEASPPEWRVFGYVAGGVEVAFGVGLFVGVRSGTGIALGTVSSVLGVAAIVTAIFVKKPDTSYGPVAAPWVSPHGAGVALSLRF